jgi:phospholipid transport system transporter-binding protein
MTKRKKAITARSKGGHLLGPPRSTTRRKSGAPRVTKSNRTSTAAAPRERPQIFALASQCTVSDAAALKERLAELLEEPLPVTLDIGALQRIDTAGLQVIAAFVRERTGQGRPVEWQGTAPVLTTAAQLLGLTSLLGLAA